MRVSRRVISPKDCVVGFGIPTSIEEFVEANGSGRSHYVKTWLGGLPQFRRLLLGDFERFMRFADLCQLSVVPRLTLSDFGRMLGGQFAVVVLFSHFDSDHIEFHDGFVDSDEVLEAVPVAFEGILDLCVCHPASLVRRLDSEWSCLVKWTDRPTAPAYWLMIYETLFTVLHTRKLSYLDALEEIMNGFREEVR